MSWFSGNTDSDSEGDSSATEVLLNPEHPLFGILPYVELLACLQDPHLQPLHPDQLLLAESAHHFISLRQEVLLEREETGEYIAPGGIRTSKHDVNHQQIGRAHV